MFLCCEWRQKLLRRTGICKESSRTQDFHRMGLKHGPRAKVGLAAHNTIRGSGSSYLSTMSSLQCWLLSSRLLTHGCRRVAAGPNITSTLKAKRRVGRWHGPVYFILIRKAKPSQKTPYIALAKWSHGHPLFQRRLGKWVFICEPCWSDKNWSSIFRKD